MSQRSQSVVIMGEASESEDEYSPAEEVSPSKPVETKTSLPQDASVGSRKQDKPSSSSQQKPPHVRRQTSKYADAPAAYNDLLHKKLRERCCDVRRDMTNLVTSPFANTQVTLGEVNRDVMKDQLIVQDAAAMLRTLTDRLYLLSDITKNLRPLRQSLGVGPSTSNGGVAGEAVLGFK